MTQCLVGGLPCCPGAWRVGRHACLPACPWGLVAESLGARRVSAWLASRGPCRDVTAGAAAAGRWLSELAEPALRSLALAVPPAHRHALPPPPVQLERIGQVSAPCLEELGRVEEERAGDVRLDRALFRACSADARRFCEDEEWGEGGGWSGAERGLQRGRTGAGGQAKGPGLATHGPCKGGGRHGRRAAAGTVSTMPAARALRAVGPCSRRQAMARCRTAWRTTGRRRTSASGAGRPWRRAWCGRAPTTS